MRFATTYTDDKPPRFYIDGVRVSRERFEFKEMVCQQEGKRYSSSYTKCKQLGNGKLKRTNSHHYD